MVTRHSMNTPNGCGSTPISTDCQTPSGILTTQANDNERLVMIITLTHRPEQGFRQRTCRMCGDPYEGWNFVVCAPCEIKGGYTVAHEWGGN